MTTVRAHDATSTITRTGGWMLILAALTGAASAGFLACIPPAVGEDLFSYPLTPAAFTGIQVFFFVHHLALVVGLLAVWRGGYAGHGRIAAVGGIGAAAMMGLLAVQELVAISAAHSTVASPEADLIGGVYGILSILSGLALVVLGIAVIRAGVWSGWRRLITLVLGVYVFAPLTPAIFGPFVVARLVIGLWLVLFAALGWALLRPHAPGPVQL